MQTTITTREQADKDLRDKVHGIMTEMVEYAMLKLDTLQRSGADIVQDHLDNECNYITPKDFVYAFAREMERQYAKPPKTLANTRTINNYYSMM